MHAIKLLAKLTTQSKQIDGMGFGGSVSDKLEVAGALGLPNPNTGDRISDEACDLAYFAYVGDNVCAGRVITRLELFCQANKGKMRDATAESITIAAVREFMHPKIKPGIDGQPRHFKRTDAELAESIGIAKQSYTRAHNDLLNKCLGLLSQWSNEAIFHINSTMGDTV